MRLVHVEHVCSGTQIETWALEGKDRTGGIVKNKLTLMRVTGQAGDGPVICFTAGIHGDEFEGPAALMRLLSGLDVETLKGTILILPAANPSAIMSNQRRSPLDGLDLNRAFPGDKNGTITEVIAAWMVEEILPVVDYVIDLHAGGAGCFLVPGPIVHPVKDRVRQEKLLGLMNAFGTPCALIADEPQAESMWDYQVEAAGKVFLTAEMGHAITLTPQSLAMTERAITNCLAHLGMIDCEIGPLRDWQLWTEPKLLIAEETSYLQLEFEGFFIPKVCAGASVAEGDVMGWFHNIDRPTQDPDRLVAPNDGIVFATSSGGIVKPESWWVILAKEKPWGLEAFAGFNGD